MNILICCLSLFQINTSSPKDTIIFIDSSDGNRIPFVNLYLNNKLKSASDGRGMIIYNKVEISEFDTIRVEALGYNHKLLQGKGALDTIKLIPQSIPLSEEFSDSSNTMPLVIEIIKSLKSNNTKQPYILQGSQQEELLYNSLSAININNDFTAYCYPKYFERQIDPFKFKHNRTKTLKDEYVFSQFCKTPYAKVRSIYPVNSIYELLVLDIYQSFLHRETYAFPFPVMESFLHFFSPTIERRFIQNNDTIYLMKFSQKDDDFLKMINQIVNSKPKNKKSENFFTNNSFENSSNLLIYFSMNTKSILQYSFFYNSKTDISRHLSYCVVQYSVFNDYTYPTKISKWELEKSEFRDAPENKIFIEHYNEAKIQFSTQNVSEKSIHKLESTSPKDKLW